MKRTATLISIALAATSAFAQWNTFHGNNQRNGLTNATASAAPRILWSYDLNGPVISSPVVAPDGSIIVGATWDEAKVPTLNIVAVNPNGTLKWKRPLPWIELETMSTPAVAANGRVYVGTPSGALLCLDSDGSEVWSYQTTSAIRSHVLLATDGNIYLQHEGKLVSWTPSGVKRWEYALGYEISGGATETLGGNILAVGAGIHCVSPSGTRVWHSTVSGTAAAVAVSPDGSVIVGGSDVVSLNPATGATNWAAGIFAYGTYGSPAIDPQGNIYYGFDYNLYKVSPTGQVLLHRFLDDPGSSSLGHTFGSPLIDATGRIYWGLGNGKRWAIAFEKAMVVFNSSLTATARVNLPEIPFTSNPAISPAGVLYIGCLDGKLYALGN